MHQPSNSNENADMLVEKIISENQYELVMEEILDSMNKGEDNLSSNEEEKLKGLALAANAFENENYREKPTEISHDDLL